jgi:hypothetical protein
MKSEREIRADECEQLAEVVVDLMDALNSREF